MTQTITQAEALVEIIKTLSLPQQEEVINFIEFLHFKAQKPEIKPQEAELLTSLPIKSIYRGIGKK